MTTAHSDLEALVGRVARRIMASFAEVTAEVAHDALARASSLKSLSLRAVDQHLAEQPSALVASSPHVPVALVGLAHALSDLGVAGVFLPQCAECGVQKKDLPLVQAWGGSAVPTVRQEQAAQAVCVVRPRRPDLRPSARGWYLRPLSSGRPVIS